MLGRSTTRARCWRKGHRRLELSLDASGRWLGALPQPLTVALEATLYWHWLERELTALGIHVLVAHPNQVKLIWQARTKTGPIDARKLADLARG
jgi:transposase